jgi:cytoskeletal protein CcmA (bactofilin family)
MRALNIYLLLFVFILLVAGVIIGIAYFQSKKQSSGGVVQSQNLSQQVLNQLASSDSQVGDAKQVLNIQSNAVFAGKVLVRDTLEVAGSIQVGGTVNLSSLRVTGDTTFSQTQIDKNLSVGGDAAIQGSVTIQKSLQVNGGGTYNGPLAAPQITTSVFQLNGDLTLTHHIIGGGPSPSRSNGPALGSGGSSSVSGSDTSGTLAVNTGNGTGSGCFATITFAQKYNGVPHVIVTPVGIDAGATDYYVTRTSSSFSICDASSPPAGASFSFDYFVVD